MAQYRTAQVAGILGVSPDTVRRWCDEGRLPWSDEGGRGVIDGAHLTAHLAGRSTAYEP